MIAPAPHVALRRRLLILHLPALMLSALVFLGNALLLNGGTLFGGLALLIFGVLAVVDLEMNA